jgi:hypothetical protein
VPDLLHVVPVGHNAVLNWVLEGEHASLALGLITDIGILLVHAHHDSWVLGPAVVAAGRECEQGSERERELVRVM